MSISTIVSVRPVAVCLLASGLLAGAAVDCSAAEPASKVAATVNGQPIQAVEVDAAIAKAVEGRQVSGEALRLLKAEALEQLIDRYLIEQRLARDNVTVSKEEVDAAVGGLEAEAVKHNTTLAKYLAEQRLTLPILRQQLTYQLGWKKYLKEHLTDDVVKEFFRLHHEEFDGAERRVSHILLRPERSGEPSGSPKTLAQAEKIREQIEQEKITFEDAATKYSAGPSRYKGGDVGFIPRRGLMDETFSQAAFRLKPDEISQPVVTQFGVHLLRITGIKKGIRSFNELRAELVEPASIELNSTVAAEERNEAKIEFTGQVPHFKPGTKVLADPGK